MKWLRSGRAQGPGPCAACQLNSGFHDLLIGLIRVCQEVAAPLLDGFSGEISGTREKSVVEADPGVEDRAGEAGKTTEGRVSEAGVLTDGCAVEARPVTEGRTTPLLSAMKIKHQSPQRLPRVSGFKSSNLSDLARQSSLGVISG